MILKQCHHTYMLCRLGHMEVVIKMHEHTSICLALQAFISHKKFTLTFVSLVIKNKKETSWRLNLTLLFAPMKLCVYSNTLVVFVLFFVSYCYLKGHSCKHCCHMEPG